MNEDFGFDVNSVSETSVGERVADIIKNLTRIVEIIDGSECLDQIDADWARANLHGALDNATKMVADAYGAHWEPDDSNLIMNCGDANFGWMAIRYKYTGKIPGFHWRCPIKLFLDALLTERTVLKAEIVCRKEFCKQIKLLLSRPRGESRTLINDVMDSFHFSDYCFKRINYLVDRVNLGDLDWEEFVSRVTDNVNHLEEIVSESYVSRYVSSAKSRMRMHREVIESAQGLRDDDRDNYNPFESEDDESECGENIPSWEHYSE